VDKEREARYRETERGNGLGIVKTSRNMPILFAITKVRKSKAYDAIR
jgi:hypothetical protein